MERHWGKVARHLGVRSRPPSVPFLSILGLRGEGSDPREQSAGCMCYFDLICMCYASRERGEVGSSSVVLERHHIVYTMRMHFLLFEGYILENEECG